MADLSPALGSFAPGPERSEDGEASGYDAVKEEDLDEDGNLVDEEGAATDPDEAGGTQGDGAQDAAAPGTKTEPSGDANEAEEKKAALEAHKMDAGKVLEKGIGHLRDSKFYSSLGL